MRKQITQAIRRAIPIFIEYDRINDPYDINCGWCEDFAMHVIEELQGGETDTLCMVWIENLIDTPFPDASHAVIRWDSGDGYIYFDSECPEGTKNVKEIPAMANQGKTREEVIRDRNFAVC